MLRTCSRALLLCALALSCTACALSSAPPAAPPAPAPNASSSPLPIVEMHWNDQIVRVQLEDTPAAKAFLAQLPAALPFEDFHGTEKIAYLKQKLPSDALQKSPGAIAKAGAVTYYIPWGNLAIFYRDYKSEPDSALAPIGQIVPEDMDKLTALPENQTVELRPVSP